ncbi:hypothetical protein [Alkalihalobacillus sp. LMS39]|uniref:hypothetical protein n=1 Tax=Alkalihalobacillus sp. LMS39 TaxID=2924032 RepID=UPI001FB4A49B|nr:hypothetical protein [Alkalihalobacillus sp. LMS39]UOE95971.1 hypothetical protein MM271_10375 [Alkalihalobacillus sp. LMS39]
MTKTYNENLQTSKWLAIQIELLVMIEEKLKEMKLLAERAVQAQENREEIAQIQSKMMILTEEIALLEREQQFVLH